MTRLRKEDQLISQDAAQLKKLPKDLLKKICFERGINIEQSLKDQIEDLKLWLSISNLRNVSHSLLISTRLNDFEGQKFEIDVDETQEEILRRSKSDTYYLESVKVFEHAFAINKLDGVIEKIQQNRTEIKYAPEEGSYQFTPIDMVQQVENMKNFKMRHKSVNDQISQTYIVSTKF